MIDNDLTDSDLSTSDFKYISEAICQAQKSPVLMRHGCVASKNGRILAKGFNHYRTYSKNNIMNNTCTCHAEMDVLHKLINNGHTDFKKITFYIVRINKKDEFRDSGPCIDCSKVLNKCGLKKIVYTTNNSIIKTSLSNYTPTQTTSGRAFINRDYNHLD
jgi:deoxycytidylate deaminase